MQNNGKKEIWILVANGSRAHIFKADNNSTLSLMNSIDHPEGRLHVKDLVEGDLGRNHSRMGDIHHGLAPTSDPKEVEANLFARHLVDHLHASQELIEKLYVSASPAFLGLIRPLMNKQLVSLVAGEIAKDLTAMNAGEVRGHFPYVL